MSETYGSGRALRADNRKRHDGVDPNNPPAPVVDLDPATMKPKERRNVTAEETKAAVEAQAALSFEQQKDAVRRANSILLARTLAKIESGDSSEGTINALAKCSNVAKQWTQEERQGGKGPGDDPDKLTDEEINRRLGNG